MILFLIECLSESSSIVSGDPFPFTVSDRDKGIGIERVMDQFMDFFGVVSLVHDIELRMPDTVTLFQEFFGMRNIMDRILGDLQSGDNLSIGINREGGFQEPFSGLTCSSRIIVTGV
jgi:hypothetical protein